MGMYALELTIQRTPPPVPVLTIVPGVQNVMASYGFTNIQVQNTGQGTMTWNAYTPEDWIIIDYDESFIYITCLENLGEERIGSIIIDAPEASNTPQTAQIIQAAASVLSPDSHEPNNTRETAATLIPVFTGNSGALKTGETNLHNDTDVDFYRLDLDSGYNYSISARVHDSYNSGDDEIYTSDVKFSIDPGTGWSEYHDTEAPLFTVSNSQTIWFDMRAYADFAGNIGTYSLDISIVRIPSGTTDPVLNVTPQLQNMPATAGWTTFDVTNLGGGSMEWTAESSDDWVLVFSTDYLSAGCRYNFGNQRTGSITITAPGAINSPQTVQIVQAAGAPIGLDTYENNNMESSAAELSATFSESNNTATVKTSGATLHDLDDIDWYMLNLPAGYHYSISPRVHDRFDSGDGLQYDCDVKFSYDLAGVLSDEYDTEINSFQVQNGGVVFFRVDPWFYGEAGSYALNLEITRTAPMATTGDVNGSGNVDLGDVIAVLRIVAGFSFQSADLEADVNFDNRIGMEEAIYVLRDVAGLR